MSGSLLKDCRPAPKRGKTTELGRGPRRRWAHRLGGGAVTGLTGRGWGGGLGSCHRGVRGALFCARRPCAVLCPLRSRGEQAEAGAACRPHRPAPASSARTGLHPPGPPAVLASSPGLCSPATPPSGSSLVLTSGPLVVPGLVRRGADGVRGRGRGRPSSGLGHGCGRTRG